MCQSEILVASNRKLLWLAQTQREECGKEIKSSPNCQEAETTGCGKQTEPMELWQIQATNPSVARTGVVGHFGLIAAEDVL